MANAKIGAGTMADKLTALLHMLRLETGQYLDQYCASVVALVTDQGTEHLLADSGPLAAETIIQDDLQALKGSVKLHPAIDQGGFLQDDTVILGNNAAPPCIETVDSSSDEGSKPPGDGVAVCGTDEHEREQQYSKTIPRTYPNQNRNIFHQNQNLLIHKFNVFLSL